MDVSHGHNAVFVLSVNLTGSDLVAAIESQLPGLHTASTDGRKWNEGSSRVMPSTQLLPAKGVVVGGHQNRRDAV